MAGWPPGAAKLQPGAGLVTHSRARRLRTGRPRALRAQQQTCRPLPPQHCLTVGRAGVLPLRHQRLLLRLGRRCLGSRRGVVGCRRVGQLDEHEVLGEGVEAALRDLPGRQLPEHRAAQAALAHLLRGRAGRSGMGSVRGSPHRQRGQRAPGGKAGKATNNASTGGERPRFCITPPRPAPPVPAG